MIVISRYTSVSNIPIQVVIETDAGVFPVVMYGPCYHFRIPGCRVRGIGIENAPLFGIAVTSNGEERRLIPDADGTFRCPRDIDRIDGILIFDGILIPPWAQGPVPFGYTYRPISYASGAPVERGISMLF